MFQDVQKGIHEQRIGLDFAIQELLNEINLIDFLVAQDFRFGTDRMKLLAIHRNFVALLDRLLRNHQSNLSQSGAVALLRALRTIYAVDLWYYLSEPILKHNKILRETAQIKNIIQNILWRSQNS